MKPLSDSSGIPCMGYGFTVGGGKWAVESPRVKLEYQNYTKVVNITCPTVTYKPKPKPKPVVKKQEEIPVASFASNDNKIEEEEPEITVTKVY